MNLWEVSKSEEVSSSGWGLLTWAWGLGLRLRTTRLLSFLLGTDALAGAGAGAMGAGAGAGVGRTAGWAGACDGGNSCLDETLNVYKCKL